MSTIDPNVKAYNAAIANDPNEPTLKDLLTQKAALDQQLANLPASHPSRAAVVSAQAIVVAAIAAHPKKILSPIDK
jgi:hypothetical protein